MVIEVSSLCFPKSFEYLACLFDEFQDLNPDASDDAFPYCVSHAFDISFPPSLFLRLFCLDCDCFDFEDFEDFEDGGVLS